MKKHGQRMEIIGVLCALLLAMASDSGKLGLVSLGLLGLLCIALMGVGYLFTRPCPFVRKSRRMASVCRDNVIPMAPIGRAA